MCVCVCVCVCAKEREKDREVACALRKPVKKLTQIYLKLCVRGTSDNEMPLKDVSLHAERWTTWDCVIANIANRRGAYINLS